MPTAEKSRQVRGVFVNYRVKATGPDGKTVVGLASTSRGDFIDVSTLADGELERLDGLGMLMPEGGERPAHDVEAAILRALNPTDVQREAVDGPMSVSPPPMGTPPRGDLTKGDTGVDPSEPTSLSVGGVQFMEEPTLPRVDAPDVTDTPGLAEFLLTGGDAGKPLTAPETVALAEDDPDRARHVLAAEKQAQGGDPRATVEKPLLKIIEG